MASNFRQAPPGASAWLHRFAVVTAAATFCLIIAGALVVGNEAGLAVPDWPLSYGMWMPPMEGGIFYEHGHRMVATFVGFLTTILVVWLWRKEPRKWVRWLGLASLLAVITQGVLGGITVLYFLPTPVSVAHACLAQVFFCMTLSLAVFTSPAWNRPAESAASGQGDDGKPYRFWHLSGATAAAIFVQLALGAALRHKGLGLAPHLAWAGVVSVLTYWMVFQGIKNLRSHRGPTRLLFVLGAMMLLQLGLGISSSLIRMVMQDAAQPMPSVVWITTAHVATGALLLGGTWVLTLLSYRSLRAPEKIPERSESSEEIWV